MAIVLHKLWDVTVEGFLLLEYKLFSSHAPKGSGSCPYTLLSIGFSIFYQKSHPSCKWAGCVFFSQEKHSSSGSLRARSSACTGDCEWCQALVIFWLNALVRRCSRVISCCSPNQPGNVGKNPSLRADRCFVLTDVKNNTLIIEDVRWCSLWRQEKDL